MGEDVSAPRLIPTGHMVRNIMLILECGHCGELS